MVILISLFIIIIKSMEFCDLGKHCSFCQRQDFLPLQCHHCNLYVCKDHKSPEKHECQKISPTIKAKSIKTKNVKCKKCRRRVKYKISCSLCGNIYCETHRLLEYHNCKKIKEKKEYVEKKN